MKNSLLLLFSIFMIIGCKVNSQSDTQVPSSAEVGAESALIESGITTVVKTDEEWKQILTDQEYYVLRQHGTERAFSGDLLENKKEGVYICRACQLPLFDSNTKFDSGTGWPSFYQPINDINIGEDVDYKIGYKRTEVHCARCNGHMGHVFDDGPRPTGLRYCINAVSLDFVENK